MGRILQRQKSMHLLTDYANLRKAIKALRPRHPGLSDIAIAQRALRAPPPKKTVTADHVLVFARRAKRFSTANVVQRFQVTPGSAAALIAILRIKGVLARDGVANDKSSQWRFCE